VTSPLRGSAREQAILAAAVALVAEIGYDRVSMDAIAARARASKMTIYRKWPGKAPLVAEALRRQAEQATPEIPDTGSLAGDLRYAVGAIAQALTGGLSLIGLIEGVRDDGVLQELVRQQIDRRTIADGALIARRAAGRGEQVEAGRVSRALGVAVAQLFLETLLTGQRPGAESQRLLADEVLMPLLAAGGPVRTGHDGAEIPQGTSAPAAHQD
jgi:AcrR family transcriptional regulator